MQEIGYLGKLKDSVDMTVRAFDAAIAPGVELQTRLAEVQTVSGLAADRMELISDRARELATTFGTDAAAGAEVFSDILSRLGPQLADYPEVLGGMARNAMTLSKTMKGDVDGAVSVLTTSFSAFRPPLADAAEAVRMMEEQMNLIARTAQTGVAGVPDLIQSFKVVGTSAQSAGVSFAEANAALLLLGLNQVKAAEAGTALQSMMLILSAPSSDAARALRQAGVDMERMADRSLPLAERLQTLVPLLDNAHVLTRLFGDENDVAARTLIEHADTIRQWTEEMQGSTSAVDQASIIMNTYGERMKRMQAKIDDLKISFFEFAEPFAPVIKWTGMAVGTLLTLGMVGWTVGNIMQLAALKTSAVWVANMMRMAVVTVAQSRIMSMSIMSIPIVGWVIALVTAVSAGIAFLYNKFEGVRVFLFALWEWLKTGFIEFVKFLWNLREAIRQVLNPLNWFDDKFSFKQVFDDLVKETFEGARKVGEAWDAGKQKGHESWANRNKTETADAPSLVLPSLNEKSPVAPGSGGGTGGSTGGNGSGGGNGSSAFGGNGGGTVRNITMNVTMNNHFGIAGEADYRKISERIKRELVAILSDAAPVIA